MKDIPCVHMHFYRKCWFLWSNLYPFVTLAKIILCNSDETGFLFRLPLTDAWNCHLLYTAFSSNGRAWGMRAYSLFLSFFFGVTPCLNLKIWPKWKILLKQFVSATPLKPLIRISWNFVIVEDIPCRCAYSQEILIQFFLSEVRPFWT